MKLVLASVAVIALAVGPARAADVPAKPVYKAAPPVVAPVPFSWTGFYIGVNAGGGWGRINTHSSYVPAANANEPQYESMASPNFRSSFFEGGGQAGFNWQIGPVVLGVETDVESFRVRGSFGPLTYPNIIGGTTVTVSSSFHTDWLFTVRPRLGFSAGPFLIYGTGGLAVANYRYNEATADSIGETDAATISKTKTGWTAGGGVEIAVLRNWSVKAEYLHVAFGSETINVPCNCIIISSTVFTHSLSRLTADMVRAGINYKFDWGKAPVVARY